MSIRLAVFASVMALAGSAPKNVALTYDKCWNVKIGDYAHGTVILHTVKEMGCIHCGAYITSTACRQRVGFRASNNKVDQAFDRIRVKLAMDPSFFPSPDPDFVAGRVYVAGRLLANGATGRPLLNADVLREAK
jgi:hypothetical protein